MRARSEHGDRVSTVRDLERFTADHAGEVSGNARVCIAEAFYFAGIIGRCSAICVIDP